MEIDVYIRCRFPLNFLYFASRRKRTDVTQQRKCAEPLDGNVRNPPILVSVEPLPGNVRQRPMIVDSIMYVLPLIYVCFLFDPKLVGDKKSKLQKLNVTSAISEAQIREPPNITESHCKPYQCEYKLYMTAPVVSLV